MSTLTRLSLANRLIVALLSIFIVIGGVVSATSLRQELLPSVQPPSAFVFASYPGASPSTMETDVAVVLEDALQGVSGVEQVISTSTPGSVQLTVTWRDGLDSEKVLAALRSAVDANSSTLPGEVTTQVVAGSSDDTPVVQLAVAGGDTMALGERLRTVALPALRGLDGVRDATVSGIAEQQVTVTVRPADAAARSVTAAQVSDALTSGGAVVPAGTSQDAGTQLSVEVGRVPASLDDVRALAIPTEDGPVTVGDVADVSSGPTPQTSLSRVDGAPALTISVTKTPEASAVSVSHAISAELDELAPSLGAGVTFTTVFDQAPIIEQSIHDLSVEGGLGLLFAVAVILVFLLSLRATIITAISIPLSLLIAMIGLSVGGLSLSIFTLGALTIAVGRVVDDSIVVIENIKRHHRHGELSAGQIVAAVREVAGAITASTLTTVAVFLPIAFISGVAGELFRPFAVTVTIALLASLLVSLTVVPVLASWLIRRAPRELSPEKAAKRAERESALEAAEAVRRERVRAKRLRRHGGEEVPSSVHAEAHPDDAVDRLQAAYLPALHLALRRPVATILVAVLLFGVTVAGAGGLKQNLLGDGGAPTIYIDQTMPAGTGLLASSDAATRLEAVLADDSAVSSYVTSIGSADVWSGGSNSSFITVILDDVTQLDSTATRLRASFAGLEGVGTVQVSTASSSGGSDVEVTVQGEDATALTAGSDAVVAMLAGVDGLAEVRSDAAPEQPILSIDVDGRRAAEYGFSQAQVGQAVSEALRGTTLGTVRIDGDPQDLVLRSQPTDASPDQIGALQLPVSAIQQAAASKRAADDLTADQNAAQDAANAESDDQLRQQLADAREQRSDAQDQLAELTTQLAALTATPAPVSPTLPEPGATTDPVTEATIAAARAQAEVAALTQALTEQQRQEQVAALQSALEQCRSAIDQLDEQVDGLIESQNDTAAARAQSADFTARSEALADVTATPIQVRDVATVSTTASASTITRTDGMRAITILATPTDDDLAPIFQAVDQGLAQLELPAGVTATVGGVATEQDESFAQLGLAMLAAIGIVFLIMAATFRGLAQPLILLVSIPFAATGALGLMLATGTALGLPAMIGLLMLIGVVVTNAIVLIDLVNEYRRRGQALLPAVIDGARLRLRPIVMTATATIFALLPMAFGLTGGGVFISQPLAIVVIGGLVSSTLLTLVLVPVLYLLVESGKERRAAKRAARRAARAEAVAP